MAKSPQKVALRMDLSRARAHWFRLQGLAEASPGPIDGVIGATGWLRTLGGVDAYLAARAREPGLGRAELDAASEARRVRVSPAARGCIYLVPAAHAGLAMRVAEDQHRRKIDRELERAGTSVREVTELGAPVLATIAAKGPLTTDALRKALPEGAARSLGEMGKKAGVSSTLPPTLRELELAGKIERTLQGGRLDSERYLWRATRTGDATLATAPATAEERNVELARLFFGWIGPATIKDFADWAGVSQRDAKAAAERAPLAPVSVEGYSDEALVAASDVDVLKRPEPATSSVRLLAFEDNFLVLHGGPRFVTAERHHGVKLDVWGRTKGQTLGNARHIVTRCIVTSEGVVGLWEMDPDARKIVTAVFDELSAAQAKELRALCESTTAFLNDEIGHARTFSLDDEDEIRKRAKGVLALA